MMVEVRVELEPSATAIAHLAIAAIETIPIRIPLPSRPGLSGEFDAEYIEQYRIPPRP